MENTILNRITLELVEKEIQLTDNSIKAVTPKWWQWCIKRGGIFKWFAKRTIKVIVVTKFRN